MSDKFHKNEQIPIAITVLLGFPLLWLESLLFIDFVRGDIVPSLFVGALSAIAIFQLVICTWLYKRGHDIKVPALLLTYSMILGPIGVLTVLVATLIYLVMKLNPRDFLEWLSALFPEYSGNRAEDIYEKIIYGQIDSSEDQRVQPFSEIMNYGTIEQRQVAIVRMSQNFKPEFAPIILGALHDEENTVRVQAASAIAVIEDKFSQQHQKLSASMKETDDWHILQKFAFLCNEYASSGLLGYGRATDLRKSVITSSKSFLENAPNNLSIRMLLGKNYLLTDQTDLALECFEKYLSLELCGEAIFYYFEALLKLRKVDEIHKFCINHSSFLTDYCYNSDETYVDSLKFWNLCTKRARYER